MRSLVLGAFLSMSMMACLQESTEPTELPEAAQVQAPAELQLATEQQQSRAGGVGTNFDPNMYWICVGAPPPACVFVWMGEYNAGIECRNRCRAAGSVNGTCYASEEISCL
jgi:hypothetical protein